MQKTNINPAILQTFLESAVNASEKGQSQFFTPAAFAAWCAVPLPVHRPVIVDLNCGAGALLHASALKDTRHLLGSDIDPGRSSPLRAGRGEGQGEVSKPSILRLPISRIQHDATLLYSKLKEVAFTADLFALNPPWRLFWHLDRFADFANSDLDAVRDAYAAREPGAPPGTMDSTIATLAMALDLCTTYGEGFLIANNNTLNRLIFGFPSTLDPRPSTPPYAMLARHIWARVVIPGNPMTGLDVAKWHDKPDAGPATTDFSTGVIYFAASHDNGPTHYDLSGSRLRTEDHGPRTVDSGLGTPDCGLATVDSGLPPNPCDRVQRQGSELRNPHYANDDTVELWTTVKEHIAEEAGKAVRVPWNLWLDVGGRIRTALSRFEEKSVKTDKAEADRLFNLTGKTPMELVLQRAERDNLLHVLGSDNPLSASGGEGWGEVADSSQTPDPRPQTPKWKIQPDLRAAVTDAIRQYHAARAPLYPLPDIQRLGYLDEQDTITCRADLVLHREPELYTLETDAGSHDILKPTGEFLEEHADHKKAKARLKQLNDDVIARHQSHVTVFHTGQKYSIRTQTVQVTRKARKPNSFTGEDEELEFTGQELAIFIADKVRDPADEKQDLTEYCFMDAKLRDDNTTISEARQQKSRRRWQREPDAVPIDFTLQQLADHFTIPDVPDVAANNPSGYQTNLEKLNQIEQLCNQT